jgi:hypothetical protein
VRISDAEHQARAAVLAARVREEGLAGVVLFDAS